MNNYIPSLGHWKEMFLKYDFHQVNEKTAIAKIKIDPSLFEFNNSVDFNEVNYMVNNFELSAWIPITVNKDYYLLDGQHRLEVAKKLGLEFIDVVILDKSKMTA